MNDFGFRVMAIDDGYGDVKFDSRGVPSLIPAFVTTFKERPEKDSFLHSNSQLQYIASEVEGKRYVVGDYAVKLDPGIQWVGSENKHSDKRFPILLKTTLGLMSENNKEVIDTLMMNLPIEYDTPERRYQLESIARGIHEVGISYDGKNFTYKTITVEDVDIKKQPFGSLCEVILDKNGEIAEPEIAKGFNVIVDIGARTLNILTLEALEEQPELTKQSNDGMYQAYIQIGRYLEKELGTTIPDGKLPQIIREREIKNKDITQLIQQVYEHHANTIIAILDTMLINSWGFVTTVIFTGGGSDKGVLRPYLERAFNVKGVNTIFLDRYANVKGLRKYGIRQAQRNTKRTNISVRVGDNAHVYRN